MSEAAKIMAEILRLAKEQPDRVYTGPEEDVCFYTRDINGCIAGENGCIFGVALFNLYHDKFLNVVKDYEDNHKPLPIDTVLNIMDLGLDKYEIKLFIAIQRLQDDKIPWREAIFESRQIIEFIFMDRIGSQIIRFMESR